MPIKLMNTLVGALAIALLGLAASSCSREADYEVLTFFFTGVPPLEEEGADAKSEVAGLTALEKREQRRAEILRQRRGELRRAIKWTHGPYAADECDRCHALASSLSFRGGTTTGTSSVPALQDVRGRLAAPIEELCIGCHVEKSLESVDARVVSVHGPVANGLCTACHSPHQSPRPYMLLGKDNVELCTQCHDSTGLRERSPEHQRAPDKDCVACHNPHLGNTAMLLRAEYDEWKSY